MSPLKSILAQRPQVKNLCSKDLKASNTVSPLNLKKSKGNSNNSFHLLSTYYVPATVLSALYILPHLVFIQQCSTITLKT